MEDPYQCHLRIHLVVTKLFHLGLPLLLNDYLWDPLGVKLVNWFASLETLEADSMRMQDLIREVAANPRNRELPNFIKVQSGASMNFGYYEHHREEDIPASLSRLSLDLARLRFALLRKLGWRAWLAFRQHPRTVERLSRALLLVPFRGRKLRKNWLVRLKFAAARYARAKQERRRSFQQTPLERKSRRISCLTTDCPEPLTPDTGRMNGATRHSGGWFASRNASNGGELIRHLSSI